MTVKFGTCEGCDNEDITGYVGCTGQQLCPNCSAQFLGVTPGEVRAELLKQLESEGKIVCKYCGRPAQVFIEDEPYCQMCAASITR